MRSIRNIAFSALLSIGAFSMVTYTACNKDECKDVVCNNGGVCVNGNCSCATGYEGANCDLNTASTIEGTYTATETCQPPLSGSSSWSSILTVSSTDETNIVISNFGDSGSNVTGLVDGNAITLNTTTIGGNTVNGTGTISGSVITINYQLTGGVTDYSCTMTMNLQ